MLPSEWATVDIGFGEAKKHLYSTDSASLEFHPTYEVAMAVARKSLEQGTEMVAVMQVNRLVRAKSIELEEIT